MRSIEKLSTEFSYSVNGQWEEGTDGEIFDRFDLQTAFEAGAEVMKEIILDALTDDKIPPNISLYEYIRDYLGNEEVDE